MERKRNYVITVSISCGGRNCIRNLLPLLVKTHAQAELLPEENRTVAAGAVESGHACRKILQAVRAVEMHMVLSCVVMKTIQCLSLRMEGKLCSEQIRYQRTPSKGKVSEGAIMHNLRKHIFRLMGQNPELCITRLIQEIWEQSDVCEDILAS